MKTVGITSVLFLLMLYTFSMLLQVNAQPIDYSNLASNITLSQEQVTEIEKDRGPIFANCIERINHKEEPGSLCDAFADYLIEKCNRFDDLLAYCTGQEVLPAIYGSKRLEQLSCIKNPPAYSDAQKIKSCINLVSLNSSYYNRPPILSANNATREEYHDEEDNSVTFHVRFTAKNEGINPLQFEKVIYDFYKQGKKLTSGCVGNPSDCTSQSVYTVPGLSSEHYQFDYTVGSNQSATLSVPPFFLNGTYYYANSNSTTTAKPFTFVVN